MVHATTLAHLLLIHNNAKSEDAWIAELPTTTPEQPKVMVHATLKLEGAWMLMLSTTTLMPIVTMAHADPTALPVLWREQACPHTILAWLHPITSTTRGANTWTNTPASLPTTLTKLGKNLKTSNTSPNRWTKWSNSLWRWHAKLGTPRTQPSRELKTCTKKTSLQDACE